MRLPRTGGALRVYAYPRLDSVVWTATDPAPAIGRVLAFDEEAGMLSFVDSKGVPGRVDFRLDNVSTATRSRLTGVSSVDGSTIYGLTKDGALLRTTPSGDWTYKPPHPARAAIPLSDGSLVLIAPAKERAAVVWRLHPPEEKILDSAEVPGAARAPWSLAGDRLYFAVDNSLVGLRTRDLQPLNVIELDARPRDVVATPSADRLFALSDSSHQVDVIDRYRERVTEHIQLPGFPEELRIDPLGRYLLVRAGHDSIWVIAIGTDRLVGTLQSAWREDLPFVAPDGAIGVADGSDVVFVDGETLKERKRVDHGASDYWYGFAWTGFRPRAASLDQPVRFPGADSVDSAARAAAESTAAALPAPPPADSAPPVIAPAPKGWMVSFFALLDEQKAKDLASTIHVHNESARVIAYPRDGQTIYRVVLGPYPSKDEADRIGRDSRQNYWVFEATP